VKDRLSIDIKALLKSWRERRSRSWGLFFTSCFRPRRSGIPHYCENHQKVDEKPRKRGGKGMLTACCLPLWGREGVTLIAAAENKRIIQKKRISTMPIFKKMVFTRYSTINRTIDLKI
jgi:hypothetical protein